MAHNMMVSCPCDTCAHNNVCIHKKVMGEVQRRINDQFYNESFGSVEPRYILINNMANAGITAKLDCRNYLEKE